MTPKEKASELHEIYFHKITLKGEYAWSHEVAKDCARVAVYEMLRHNVLKHRTCGYELITSSHVEYWNQVQREIDAL